MGVGLPREFHSEILGEDFFEIWRSCVFFGGWFDEKKNYVAGFLFLLMKF